MEGGGEWGGGWKERGRAEARKARMAGVRIVETEAREYSGVWKRAYSRGAEAGVSAQRKAAERGERPSMM